MGDNVVCNFDVDNGRVTSSIVAQIPCKMNRASVQNPSVVEFSSQFEGGNLKTSGCLQSGLEFSQRCLLVRELFLGSGAADLD